MDWNEMLTIMKKSMNYADKKIKNIPKFLFNLGTKSMLKQQKKHGIEGGLYMPKLGDIQYSQLFIDKSLGCVPLGVTEDDIEGAIADSMKLCLDIIKGKAETIDMKGE